MTDYNPSTGLLSTEETPFRLLTSDDLVVSENIYYRGVHLDPNLYLKVDDISSNLFVLNESFDDLSANVVRTDKTEEQTIISTLNTRKLRLNDGNDSTSDSNTAYFWYDNNYGGFTVNGQQLFSGTGNAINFFASAGAYFNGNLVFSGDNNDVVISKAGSDGKSLRLQAGDDNTTSTHYIELIARDGQRQTYTAMRVDGVNERIDINKSLQINEDIEFNNTVAPSNTDKRLYMKTTQTTTGSPPFQIVTNTYDLMFQDKNITADLIQAEADIDANTATINTIKGAGWTNETIYQNAQNISTNATAISTIKGAGWTNETIYGNAQAITSLTGTVNTINGDYVSKTATSQQNIASSIQINNSLRITDAVVADHIYPPPSSSNDLLVYKDAGGKVSLTLGVDTTNVAGQKHYWTASHDSTDGFLRLNQNTTGAAQTGNTVVFTPSQTGLGKVPTDSHKLDVNGSINASSVYASSFNGGSFTASGLGVLNVGGRETYKTSGAGNDYTTRTLNYNDTAHDTRLEETTTGVGVYQNKWRGSSNSWATPGGTVKFEIDTANNQVVSQSPLVLQTLNAGIYLAGASPATTTNMLYHKSTDGNLYWNGQVLQTGVPVLSDPTDIGQAQVGTYGTSSYARFGHKDASQALLGLVCYDNGSSDLISSSTGWSRLTDAYGTTRIGHINNVIYNKADDICLQSAGGVDRLRVRSNIEFEVPSGGAIYMNEGASGIATLASSGNTLHPNTTFNNNAIVNGQLDVRSFIRERIAAKNWVDKTLNYDNTTYTNRVEYLSDATGETTTHTATVHKWNNDMILNNGTLTFYQAQQQKISLCPVSEWIAGKQVYITAINGNTAKSLAFSYNDNTWIQDNNQFRVKINGNDNLDITSTNFKVGIDGDAVLDLTDTDFAYKAPMNNGSGVVQQDCLTANNTQLTYYISNKTGSGTNNRRFAFRAGSSGTNEINKHIEIGDGSEDVLGQNQIRLNGTGSMIYVSPSASNSARFTSGIICDSTGAFLQFDSSTPSIQAKTTNGVMTNAFHPLFSNINYYDANQHQFRFKDANGGFLSGGVAFTPGGNVYVNGGLVHSSDRRIKKNIEELKDDECLDILRKLKPCKYNYIDPSRGTSKVYGFIAQEVQEVLPYAVKKITDVIPNVLGDAVINGDVITLPTAIDLAVGTRIKTDIGELMPDEYNEVLEKVSSNQYRCSNLKDKKKCKVFGTLVDDFHDLNKNAVWTVATSALQELDRKVSQIADQSATITRLKEDNANLKLKMASLESKIAILTEAMLKNNLL